MAIAPSIAQPRLVYIAGWGRSGTTLIGGSIEASLEAVYIGELWNLWEDYEKPSERCSCGNSYRDCPFWTHILSTSGLGDADIKTLAKTKQRYMGTRSLLTNKYRLKNPGQNTELGFYRDSTIRIYRAVANATGHGTIIDASKTPNLIYLLRPLDPAVLHVVRDPRAVAYSWWYRPKATHNRPGAATMAQHSPIRSTFGWLARNAAIETAKAYGDANVLTATYEKFVNQHESAFAEISEFLHLPPRIHPAPESHSVRGNPGRFNAGRLTITKDNEWNERLPAWMFFLISGLSFPLMRKYGYQWRRL